MTSCLYVSNPITRDRRLVSNVDLQNTVSHFKGVINSQLGIFVGDQELIFLGECLDDDERSLVSYGLEDKVTVFVLEKIGESIGEDVASSTLLSVEEVQVILKKAQNELYKHSIKKYIKNKEEMEKYINSTESVKKDRITCSLLRDPDLLLAVIETSTAERIAKEYPNLGIALKHIVSNSAATARRLPVFGDNEQSDYEGLDPSHIAQAEMLAAAVGNNMQGASSSSQSSQQALRNQISASDLANALSFATTLSSERSESASTSHNVDQSQIEQSLEQMRAVGITDEALSRRALTMSGGNVEVAINLIFEGGLS